MSNFWAVFLWLASLGLCLGAVSVLYAPELRPIVGWSFVAGMNFAFLFARFVEAYGERFIRED